MMTSDTTSTFHLIRNRIIAGLFIIIPLGVSLWIGYFIFDKLTEWGVQLTNSVYNTIAANDWLEKSTLQFLSDLINSFWIKTLIRLLSLFIIFVSLFLIGVVAKWTIGKKLISWAEQLMMKVPMLNTVYSTVQQIGEAIWAPKGGMFRQVVLFEYPRKGIWVIGFLTNENNRDWELDKKTGEELLSIFLPTTPNPTSGFLLFIPRKDCIMLDMDIAEGMRLVISGGAVPPPLSPLNTRENTELQNPQESDKVSG